VRRGKRNWMVGRKGPLITNTCIGLTHQMTLLRRAVGITYASGLQSNWNEVATAETRKQTLKKSFCHIEVIDGGLADADADVTNPLKLCQKRSSNMVKGIPHVKTGSVDNCVAGG
jgi:hypothetical protein